MAQVDISVENYQDYIASGSSRYAVDVVNGAILYELLNSGFGSGTGSGTGSNSNSATAANQESAIALLTDLRGAIAPLSNTTPNLEIATEDGVVEAGAKLVTFTIYPNTVGTILGATITPELNIVEFPFNLIGYKAFPYTIASGTIIITSAF